jgi:hypothetical protein
MHFFDESFSFVSFTVDLSICLGPVLTLSFFLGFFVSVYVNFLVTIVGVLSVMAFFIRRVSDLWQRG